MLIAQALLRQSILQQLLMRPHLTITISFWLAKAQNAKKALLAGAPELSSNHRNGQLKIFQGYSSGVWSSIAFSPDRQTLVSAGADQMIKVWNVSDDKCLGSFRGHTDMVRFVAYSPQGNTLASCGADRTVKLWNILDGRCLMTFKSHANWVMSVKYSPDGQTLASAFSNLQPGWSVLVC